MAEKIAEKTAEKTLLFTSDHAGAELRHALIAHLSSDDWQIEDLGVDETCDYPDCASRLAHKMKTATADTKAVLVCGSGIGMSMAGNRYPWMRVALCHDAASARLARQHNNANALALAGRMIDTSQAITIMDAFFTTAFEGGRHQRRVDKMTHITE